MMFQLVKETHVRFMETRRYAYFLSGGLLLLGVISVIAHHGFRLGVDFTGGRLIEYRFSQPLQVETLRNVLSDVGIIGEIQSVGAEQRDFLVRIPVREEQLASADSPSQLILDAVKKQVPGIDGDLRKEELVGPKVGSELKKKAFWAIVIALAGILIYVGWRYEFTFALGGVIALAHDVLLTLFLFSVLNLEITIPIIAALLTIGGYSINDTVVVFDRIREQSKLLQGRPLQKIIDLSVNMTLSRTLITALTTVFAAGALCFLGGEVIHDFAFAIMIGVIVGTYSSIYVASAIALDIDRSRARKKAA
jgi:preprotein translocase SecF subunit